MYSLNEILLPTDFSPRSTDLARYAAARPAASIRKSRCSTFCPP